MQPADGLGQKVRILLLHALKRTNRPFMLTAIGMDVRLDQACAHARGMHVARLLDMLQRAIEVTLVAVSAGLFAAVVGDDPTQLVPRRLFEPPRARDRLRPVLLLLVDVDELAQRLDAIVCILGKLAEEILGAVEQTRAHVVLSELEQRLGTLRDVQRLSGDEILVDADGTVDVTAAAVQVSEREMRLHRLAVDLDELDEDFNCLVRLLVEEIVDALEVVGSQSAALALARCPARGSACGQPAGAGRYRQQQPEHLESEQRFEHHAVRPASAGIVERGEAMGASGAARTSTRGGVSMSVDRRGIGGR